MELNEDDFVFGTNFMKYGQHVSLFHVYKTEKGKTHRGDYLGHVEIYYLENPLMQIYDKSGNFLGTFNLENGVLTKVCKEAHEKAMEVYDGNI